MRKTIYIFGFCFLLLSPLKKLFAQGHHIKINIKGVQDTILYLGNYYGNKTYLSDSTHINSKGHAVFSGKENLPAGIYFLLLPDKRHYFELLLDQQQDFSMTTDSSDLTGDMQIKNSRENQLFYQYNKFLSSIQPYSDSLKTAISHQKDLPDSAVQRQVKEKVTARINDYRQQFINQHPDILLSDIFRAMKDPEVPETHLTVAQKNDSAFSYHYFREHYWDDYDFSDSGLVRTPVLEARLQKYFSQLVPPQPDSINAAADKVIAKAKANREVFKYVLWWLTYTYETSQYMGMDAVFVHLVEKYYIPGEAYWITDDQKSKIIQRAYSIAPNLIGQQAPPLKLKTAVGKDISLYNVPAKYTVVVFWDPTCGHCQLELPKMDSAYEANWKNNGVKIFSVRTGGTKEQWQDFIKNNHLQDWINTWDPDNTSNYHNLYDVYSTPVTYLLDKNKKIVAKRLDTKQLSNYLKHLGKEKDK